MSEVAIDKYGISELEHCLSPKKKKKKKKSKPVSYSYYIHKETSNKSFIKMYKMLKDLGVQNNKFFLALYDTELIDVDPFSENLSMEMQIRVIRECKINCWYYLRECCRIPVSGSGIGPGKGKKYQIHRGNLAMTYCCIKNINFYVELPRQNFKSQSHNAILAWLLNFGTNTSTMLLMNKDHDGAKDNIARIKDQISCLPLYLQGNLEFNKDGERVKAKGGDNKEFVFNTKTNNKIETKASPTNELSADNAGRGNTHSIQTFDEFGFLKYNDIIFKAAKPALSQASREAEENNKPHFVALLSTPGDMDTSAGKSAYKYIQDSARFVEKIYDFTDDEFKEYIKRNSINKTVLIHYNYKQLGRDEKWFEDEVIEMGNDWAKIRREYLLQWGRGSMNSPYPPEDLLAISDKSKTVSPLRTLYINKFYTLNLYHELDVNVPVILGIDTSSGIGKDSSSIVLIDSRDRKILGIFENCRIDTDDLTDVIYTLATQIVPNCVICIERNHGSGSTVLSKLLKTNIAHKVYKELNINDLKEKVKHGFVENREASLAEYGIWTDESKRIQMHEVLNRFVLHYKDRISIPEFCDQLATLEMKKNGRIDHADGKHDDIIMAYLMGIWAFYYGNNITSYGIIKLPDPAPNSSLEEDMVKQYNEAVAEKRKQELMSQYDYDETLTMPGSKTMKDFYKEQEYETERLLDRQINNTEDSSPMSYSQSINILDNIEDELYDNDDIDFYSII